MISIEFEYAKSEYVKAMSLHYRERLNVPLDLTIAALTAVAGAYLVKTGAFLPFGVLFLAISLFLVLMVALALYVMPIVLFRKNPKLRDQYHLTFTRDRIEFRTKNINSNLKWSIYNRVLYDAHSYLLYYGSFECTVIPVRVFRTRQDKEAFEALLRNNIPDVQRR